jgi:PIN domain nuclease of toxin-antitoxin system
MRLLLDTHVFLWAATGSASLKAQTRRTIEDADAVFVSAASIWEIAIKARLGKITADLDALVNAIKESGFVDLPVSTAHAAGVARLPLLHDDPFDRLLLAQAIAEPLRFLTADVALKPYSDLVTLA